VSDVRWTNRSFPEPQTELDEDGAVTVSGDLDCAVTYTSTGLFGDDAPQEIKDEDTSTYWASVDLSAPSPVVTFNQ
jgi:hypothetical protein